MVVIQCPHCSMEVELDGGASGLFDCPHCGEEFQWGKMDAEIEQKRRTRLDWTMSRVPLYVGITFFLGALSLFLPVFLGIFFLWVLVLAYHKVRWRMQRYRDKARDIQSIIKGIKEFDLD